MEVICLVRMQDDRLSRQTIMAPIALLPITLAIPVRRLSLEEMQWRRAQSLCFNRNEQFIAGHQSRDPRILMIDG